jgi:DNA-directed RNA polymerase specialized sigma24 family protein
MARRLNERESAFYARIYGPARAGSMRELRRAGCSEDEADDIFSGTFLETMSKVDPFSRKLAEAQLISGIKTTCQWRLIDRRRHDGCIPLVPLTDVYSVYGNGADELAAEREVLEVVLEAVRSLPERDQQIYSLRMWKGLDPEEIQLLLDVSPRSYRKGIQRANSRVSAALMERGIGRKKHWCDRSA